MENRFLYDVLTNYYNHLSTSGKINKKDQCSILMLTFFNDLLNSELSIYINEEDYSYISSSLNSIYGSNCVIPYPEYKDKLSKNNSSNIITANPIIRNTHIGFRNSNELYRLV